ncbi:MAG: hydroxymethylbilane synthase [Desulfotomaculaceae bacterium]|nr:hydroxymethylbilane synthase [Desulfotomaculaceae bacterium]
MKKEIVVGARESNLALRQAEWVTERLREINPKYRYSTKGIRTLGDRYLDVALSKIGDKGLFTKELELALQHGEIDLAVHSMKDLPVVLPEGLLIGAVCRRENPSDALVARHGLKLADLPAGAIVGTSSLRRCAQLLYYRSDLKIVNLRGNINTRLRKLAEEGLDAAVLAYAGLHRLGLEKHITQLLPFELCLPAVGQGALGVEIRGKDEEVRELISGINDDQTRAAITAERALLERLEGGCQAPVGALGVAEGDHLSLEGVVAALDGSQLIRASLTGSTKEPTTLGVRLAEKLIKMGAGKLLEKVRRGVAHE